MTIPNLNQVAEVSLNYKSNCDITNRPKVTCSKDSYDLLINNWNNEQLELREEFKVLLLNRANKVLGLVTISTGGISSTVVDPKLVFASALKACASSIVLAHNHPSLHLKPSKADIKLTNKLVQAGEFLDIEVLDHLIITPNDFYSFADEGAI